MTYYLRNENNQTLVDLEVSKDDLHCVIDIKNYSEFLLNSENKQEVIQDFDNVSEIRGLWFENMNGVANIMNVSFEEMTKDSLNLNRFVRIYLNILVKKYNLLLVTD